MNPESSQPLERRVADLEQELRALRRRVAALEGVEFVEMTPVPLASQPLAPQPVAPTPLVPVAPPSLPPPVPVAARTASSAAAPSGPTPAPRAAAVAPPPPSVAAASLITSAPPPAEPPRPSALRELLDALGLLPPSGQRAGEAGIGAWWATRLGALILVIGVVFLGVYVSLATPPWVRLVELAAIAGGMVFGGLWLERKVERMGSVVMGAGLALAYFTAFAAYAVPAVKVIESVAVGAFVQALAVIAIGGTALWRRWPTAATMAVLLGYVSAFFSMSAGFDDFAVAAGLGLSAMAVFFRWRQGWGIPVLLSAGLAHVLNAVVATTVWDTEIGRPSLGFAFGVIAAAWAAHWLSVVLEGGDARGRISTVQRWIQSVNTSLGVMAGFAVALVVLPEHEHLSWYFFAAGAVLLGAAAWAWRTVPEDGIFGMFAVKAASLIALGVIVEWDARTRWLALVVQSAVIMAAAVRTRRRSLAITALLAWLVSLVFFGDDVDGLRGALISGDGIAVGLYLLGGAALLSWISTWVTARQKTQEMAPAVPWALGIGAALPVGMAVVVAWDAPWTITACVVISLLFAGIARLLRSLVPVIGAVGLMLAAHVLVQVYAETTWGLAWLWAGAALITLRSGVLGWLIGTRGGPRGDFWTAGSVVLLVLALAALGGATMQSMELHPALAIAAGLAVLWVAAGAQLRRDDMALAGFLGLPLAYVLFRYHQLSGLMADGPGGWLWVAAGAVPVALALVPVSELDHRGYLGARGLAAIAGILFTWMAADLNLGALALAWTLLAAAALYLGLGAWRDSVVAKISASVLLAITAGRFLVFSRWAAQPGGWALLVAVFTIVMVLAAVPLAQRAWGVWLPSQFERPWRIAHAAAATLALFALATLGRAVWSSYGSVVWGLGGVVLFVLGLMMRARSHRLAGLIALGLCIPRVFLYDIQSTTYRIAAFVVLGVLLLIVGFSYQKFRYLVEGDGAKPAGEGEAAKASSRQATP